MVLTVASIRSSVAVLVWIVSFDVTLVLLAASCWNPDMPKVLTAAGGVGCFVSIRAFQMSGAAS